MIIESLPNSATLSDEFLQVFDVSRRQMLPSANHREVNGIDMASLLKENDQTVGSRDVCRCSHGTLSTDRVRL